ncbi:IS200/IS605 family transposase [Thiotrichales bacterium 19S3-7]|nr:IS200/IS605 family transposase [Thiotrichales bacterium 19S3-7]MCF6803155.1 IS200/IS605 family transposase [Thiotrichales bacterium 19S3-11]
MKVYKSAHSTYRLEYHVVWVCKYRRGILNPGVCSYLKKLLPKLLRSMPGVHLEEIGFDEDHLHMIMVIPPKYSISEVMGRLKSQSASELRKVYSWLKKVYWKENLVWSPGYFVSSVGVDEDVIRNYVLHQGMEDSGQIELDL